MSENEHNDNQDEKKHSDENNNNNNDYNPFLLPSKEDKKENEYSCSSGL